MALLDAYANPVDQGTALRSKFIIQGLDDDQQKRDAEKLEMEARRQQIDANKAQAERAKLIEARAQSEDQRATAAETRRAAEDKVKQDESAALIDARQWAGTPGYDKTYDKVPDETRAHFEGGTYAPEVAAKIPTLYNQALRERTGQIPGLDPTMVPKQQNVDEKGNVTTTRVPAAPEQPQFDEFTTPQDVAAKMPAEEASIAEQLGNYKINISALGRMPSATKLRILQAAKVYNPDFDVKEFNNQNKARQAFTTGTQGQNIAAINTALGHLSQLHDLSKKLGNSGFTPYNALSNTISKSLGGSAVTQFDQTKEAVASELAKVFKGSGVTSEAQMKEWRAAINSSMSPDQLEAAISNAVHLMGSRIEELDRQWSQLTKAPRDFSVLGKNGLEALKKLGVDPSALEPNSGNPAAPVHETPAPAPAPARRGTPTPASPATPRPATVRMLSPDGHYYQIPAANVEAAKARGFQ